MSLQRAHQSSPQKTQTQQNTSQFALRPLTVQTQQNAQEPLALGGTGNESFGQGLEQAVHFGHHFANISVFPPGAQVSAPIQLKQVYLNSDKPAQLQASEVSRAAIPGSGENERLNFRSIALVEMKFVPLPVVQRRLSATAVRNVTTPYQPAVDRMRGEFTLGYTPPVINGQRVEEQGGHAVAEGALGRPTLAIEKAQEGAFRARVDSEPVNVVSSDQQLMVNPPWTAQGNGHRLILACEGLGNINLVDRWDQGTLEVTGKENPEQLQAQVREHENYHAADNLNAAVDIILPWDAALSEMRRQATAYEAPTAEQATALLYSRAGGTPQSIARQVTDEWMARSDAYHRTPAGGTTVHDPQIDEPNRRVTLRITQP